MYLLYNEYIICNIIYSLYNINIDTSIIKNTDTYIFFSAWAHGGSRYFWYFFLNLGQRFTVHRRKASKTCLH